MLYCIHPYITRPAAITLDDGTPVMATTYPPAIASASFGKGGATPHNTPNAGVMPPARAAQDRKLLDQFRDKMRSLHYSLATEKAYRHWIVEFLRFHRDGNEWKYPAT